MERYSLGHAVNYTVTCSRTFKVAVEGNIGCGKSTFLQYFKKLSPKIQVSPEAIELWKDVKGFKFRQLSDGDVETFNAYYEWGLKLPIFQLDLIVYLRCSPEVCAERVRKRNRRGEGSISMDYLNQLHDLHEDWLLGSKTDCVRPPIIVFDCNEPLENLTKAYFQRRDQVLGGVRF
ncbi:unnamed protein product [Taenia asiatica]|uniref:DNK domain-containing protein n=1 Tax=Taenia asiatica TaxID=60517 RepID=A0A0R3WEA2_TAEAS|nr:unnamed protein product [Taenia asiatica]